LVYKNKKENRLEDEIIQRIMQKDIYSVLFDANSIREKYKGSKIELCAIINAKSGRCSEDCIFCAQSSRYKTKAPTYPLVNEEKILEKALEAKKYRVKRFSIVISGRNPSKRELKKIGQAIEVIKKQGIGTCASLGLLNYDEVCFLRDCGLERLHCNLETSPSFFEKICRTHKFEDKVRTIEYGKKADISICSGGVFGMGESWHDRVELALFLRDLDIDSVPINFLHPIKGTPLEDREPLKPMEALRIISLFRSILPSKDIRICGGRLLLGDFASWIFLAGANALMTGDYLTTSGRHFVDDLRFIENHGFEVDDVVC